MKYIFIVGILLFIMSCSQYSSHNEQANSDNILSQTSSGEVIMNIGSNIGSSTTGSLSDTVILSSQDDTCIMFEDFIQIVDYTWGIVNDGVMGGKSLGKADIVDDTLVFSGEIVTRGGGFSSLRGRLEIGDLSEYNSVKFRAQSDGREYRVTFRDNRWGNISHRAIIPFQTPGEIEEVTVSFTDLEPAYFGRRVDTDPFNKDAAREIGIILSDGVDGDFRLIIDEVRFCK